VVQGQQHCDFGWLFALLNLSLPSPCYSLPLSPGTTRILVTHQRQYLPKCDRIAVLRNGQLAACGTYEEASALQLPELIGGAVTMSLDTPTAEQEQQELAQSAALAATQLATVVAAAVPADAISASEQQQQQHAGKAVAGTSSSSLGSSEDSEDSIAGRMLSRVRTMAPDINKRPADSGQLQASSSNGSIWAGNSNGGKNSFVRAASRLRMWGSGVFQRQQQQDEQPQPQAVDITPGPASGGVWSRLKSRVYFSITSLFTPPAYLPGGVYYSPPQQLKALELQPGVQSVPSAVLRGPSLKGLAMLGPVRSLMPHGVAQLTNGSGKWQQGAVNGVAAAAGGVDGIQGAAAGKEVSSNGTVAAAAAPVGQLVAAEGREIGSVSWSVYGQYCKQLGVLTTVLLTCALFAGQVLVLAAEWWLALWASSSPAEQRQSR
jgi:hypothetical protein